MDAMDGGVMLCWPSWAEGAGSGPCGCCQRCPPCPSSSASLPALIAARLHQPWGCVCFTGQEGGGEGPCGHPGWAGCGGPPWPPFRSVEGLVRSFTAGKGPGGPPGSSCRDGVAGCTAWGETACACMCVCTLTCVHISCHHPEGPWLWCPPALHPPPCLGPLVVICSSEC